MSGLIKITVEYPSYENVVTSTAEIDAGDLADDARRNGWREFVVDTETIEAKIAEREVLPEGSVARDALTAEIRVLSENPQLVRNPVSPGEYLVKKVVEYITELLVDDEQFMRDVARSQEQVQSQHLSAAAARIAIKRPPE